MEGHVIDKPKFNHHMITFGLTSCTCLLWPITSLTTARAGEWVFVVIKIKVHQGIADERRRELIII
jgi:hypothetical protein